MSTAQHPGGAVGLTQARLRALLDYDEHTGVFTRRVSQRGRAKIGMVAGTLRADGYMGIMIDRVPYKAHRLAWLYVHDCWPAALLDHKNGKRDDNRIDNLRECTNAENHQNYGSRANKKSGLPLGVSPSRGKYQAQIRHSGKRHHLGTFPTPALAHAAYLAAKAEHHQFNPIPRNTTTT